MNPMLSQRRELNMRKGTAVGLQSRRRRHLPEPRIISPMWSAGASHLRCFDWCPADPVLKSSFTCEQQCALSYLPQPVARRSRPISPSPNLPITIADRSAPRRRRGCATRTSGLCGWGAAADLARRPTTCTSACCGCVGGAAPTRSARPNPYSRQP